MKTKLWAIGLMLICTVFISLAQVFYKFGSKSLSFDLISILANWQIILGIVLYASASVLVIMALRGGQVTVLFPILTSSYILVTLSSAYFFHETISWSRWAGVFSIIVGILFIVFEQEKT